MASDAADTTWNWLRTGNEAFSDMLGAIEAAQVSVCLESYTFSEGSLGEEFREALTRARHRGVKVQVLVDAIGSIALPGHFWDRLQGAGGEVRVFNPLALKRFWIRNHRKLLVCDRRVAFLGGFNIAPEYEGDGVTRGWRDVGLRIEGSLATRLAASFEEMFARADFRHRRFMRWRRFDAKKSEVRPLEQILFSGPGRGSSPIKRALRTDLAVTRDVRIIVAYFLPTWRLRRELMSVVRRGGRVQLILAGKSDVLVSHLAGRSLYRRFLRGGAKIFEYGPQVLHAKLMILDGAVYVGSANLDQRSLNINYELMIRFENPRIAEEARDIFGEILAHSRRVDLESWRRSRSLWQRLEQRLAYFILVRIDPYIARRQWRALPD